MRDLSDRVLTEEQRATVQELGQLALKGSAVSREVYKNGLSGESLYAAAPVYDAEGKPVGAVCLLLSLQEFETTLRSTRTLLIVFSAGLALLSLLIGLALATLLTRPLSGAQQLAARVSEGDYALRLPQRGPLEIAELAGHLNSMAEQLEKQTRERQIMLANLTHELARPLGGLRLGAESLRDGALQDSALAEDLLTEMIQTTQRMESLLDDLAVAARPVSSPLRLALAPVSIEPLIYGLKARYWPRAETRSVMLVVDLPENLPMVMADETRLYQVIGNLMDNAIKFTPPGGEVRISAEVSQPYLHLTVQDTGPGISSQDLNHVFEPFYQGSQSTQIKQGMGLGLPIAHQLIVAQGGKLSLQNRPEGGLEVRVDLLLA
jgi:signal transduction histidine kinase